jgi:hypothetical protein
MARPKVDSVRTRTQVRNQAESGPSSRVSHAALVEFEG